MAQLLRVNLFTSIAVRRMHQFASGPPQSHDRFPFGPGCQAGRFRARPGARDHRLPAHCEGIPVADAGAPAHGRLRAGEPVPRGDDADRRVCAGGAGVGGDGKPLRACAGLRRLPAISRRTGARVRGHAGAGREAAHRTGAAGDDHRDHRGLAGRERAQPAGDSPRARCRCVRTRGDGDPRGRACLCAGLRGERLSGRPVATWPRHVLPHGDHGRRRRRRVDRGAAAVQADQPRSGDSDRLSPLCL